MNLESFKIQIGRLESLFGAKAFPEQRLKIIWHWTKDLYDYEFEKIITHMASALRQPPMPVEFKEAAGREMRSRYGQNSVDLSQYYNISCEYCFDTGICQASSLEDDFKTLAECDCIIACDRNLPKINAIINFTKEPLDTSWFKPESEMIEKSILDKAESWLSRISTAENYWLTT